MGRIVLLLFLITACIVSSCNDTASPKEIAQEISQNPSDTLKIPKLKGLKPTIRLTKEAKEEVSNWTFYTDVSAAIDSLNGSTVGALKPSVDRLTEVFVNKENAEEAEVRATPESMDTRAIQARVLSIETQLNLLRNHISRSSPDVDQMSLAVVKIKNGLQHLNLQLNERFNKSIKELLEEIQNEKGDIPASVPENTVPTGKPKLDFS